MNQTQNIASFQEPSTSSAEGMAKFYKAAGDSIRLDILRVLKNESFGVQELAYIFSVAQPAMSHHLKVLTKSELAKTRRQGNTIFYRRAMTSPDSKTQRMMSNLFQELDKLPLQEDIQKNIEVIYEKRSKVSRAFFEKNAHQFTEKQGELCELTEYLRHMMELLELANLSKNAKVLEVGPGHGGFLRELSGRYSNLVALDRSEKILGVAKKQMANRAEKIKFICQPLEDYQLETSESPYDVVILNMVLHHIPSPMNAFHKLSELVVSNGFIMIADLTPHEQEWVKNSCGDLWLGLEPQELQAWANEAGFQKKQSLYLGLKNGFQIQLKLFQNINV